MQGSFIARAWHEFRVWGKKNWKVMQYVFASLVLLLMGLTLYTQWHRLSAVGWDLDYGWFIASVLLVSITLLSMSLWWTWSLNLLHARLKIGEGVRIWVFSQLAKYLPGGIWNYASRVYRCDQAGIAHTYTTLSLVVEAILRVQAAIIVFLISLPLWPHHTWSTLELIVMACALLLGFGVLNPRFLNWGVNVALRFLHRPPVQITALPYKHILGLLLGHILTVMGTGLAFYVMVVSVYQLPLQMVLPITGMLAISVISGFLNPLTPQGLGTREGLLTLLLTAYMPLSIAVVVALLARLWLILSEILSALLVFLVIFADRYVRGAKMTQ